MSKDLCLRLIKAESEEEVVAVLRSAGHWDDPAQWRHYGDNELNWSQAGGQQARADFAFAEKVVNSIDSVLTRMALERGIAPDGPHAPATIREAVARFVENVPDGPLKTTAGRIEDWGREERRKVAKNISVFTTEPTGSNAQRRPTLSIADLGEGHVPAAFPSTFVSLGRRNKVSIPFVQGKFCQGGSGALRYCGESKLQLVVSRRMPSLVGAVAAPASYPSDPATDGDWGFTVVRREAASGSQKMSTYTYLAPVTAAATPRRGGVLSFSADTMPLFPDGTTPYARDVEWGTLIKLFEYKLPSSSNILRRSGLLPRMDLLLPDPALPMRMHECRPRVGGKDASEQTTTMAGLFTRLRGNANLEAVSPSSVPITVSGRALTMRIFAFKPGKAGTYRDSEGVVFTVNGQAHAYIKANIFARKRVGLMRLASDLLLYVDCSTLSPTELEDAFMSSRDRLVEDNAFAKEIERRIEEALHDHEGLRRLKAERAAADLEAQLADNKPLEDVLKKVLKTSPALARLFGTGVRLHNPLAPTPVATKASAFQGRPHPSFFRFHGKVHGQDLRREAHIGRRIRLRFETDVENEYFTRRIDPGSRRLEFATPDGPLPVESFSGPTLNDGVASLNFDLPPGISPDAVLEVALTVEDEVTGAAFTNKAFLTVRPEAVAPPRPSRPPKPRGSPDAQGHDGPSGIALPNVRWISRSESAWKEHFEDIDDCLHVVDDAEAVESGTAVHDYTFYLNEDNRAVRTEIAANRLAGEAIKKQFEVAMTLVGLAVLHESDKGARKGGDADEDEERPFSEVARVSRALAPVLLPVINSLSDLGQFEADESDLVGLAA